MARRRPPGRPGLLPDPHRSGVDRHATAQSAPADGRLTAGGGRAVYRSVLGNGTTTAALVDSGAPGETGREAASWVPDVSGDVDDLLLAHGAVLLRGFGVTSPEEFEVVARAVGGTLYTHN